jgi:hypothetical protein
MTFCLSIVTILLITRCIEYARTSTGRVLYWQQLQKL